METGRESHDERVPLRLEETRVYLAEWLARREDGTGGLSEDQIRQIHRVSGGRPDRVEQLARQCLTDPVMQPDDAPAKHSPATVAVIVSVAVISILAVIMLMSPPVERKDGPVTPVASADRPAETPQTVTPAEPGNPSPAAEPQAATAPPPPSDGAREERVLLSGVRTRDWLMEENGDQYVLQLIGATEVKTIGNFVARAAIPEHQLTLLRSRRNGEDWYTLVYGLYPDAATAREQRRKLPSWVREQKPWPRRLAEVLEDSYR